MSSQYLLHLFNHLNPFAILHCLFIVNFSKYFVSFAKRNASDVTHFGRSFINMPNSRGPRTDSCGVPDVTSFYDDPNPLNLFLLNPLT